MALLSIGWYIDTLKGKIDTLKIDDFKIATLGCGNCELIAIHKSLN